MHSIPSIHELDTEARAKRVAESSIRSAILRNAQGCSLNISRLIAEVKRPLTRMEVRMCMAQERVAIQEEGIRMRERIAEEDRDRVTSVNYRDLESVLDRPDVRDVLEPGIIDGHRRNHRQELIDMLALVMPHYHDCPEERMPDVLATIDVVRTVLPQASENEENKTEALVA